MHNLLKRNLTRRGASGLIWLGALSLLGQEARPLHQLRVYDLVAGTESAFHARFRDHAMRIMARHGFHIVATWTSPSEKGKQFIYLLEWKDRESMDRAWKAFLADEEWIAIKKKTAASGVQIMGDLQSRVLELTDYSPQAGLAEKK